MFACSHAVVGVNERVQHASSSPAKACILLHCNMWAPRLAYAHNFKIIFCKVQFAFKSRFDIAFTRQFFALKKLHIFQLN